jgi:hypothetical protein
VTPAPFRVLIDVGSELFMGEIAAIVGVPGVIERLESPSGPNAK